LKRAYTYIIHLLFIVLAGAWLLHFVYPVYYAARSKEVKNNQRETIMQRMYNEFEIKQLSYADFERYREGDELSIDGEMYDIIHISYSRESVICKVLKDAAETELHKSLARNINAKRVRNSKPMVFWCPVADSRTRHISFIYFQPLLPEHSLTAPPFIANVYIDNIIQPPEQA